MIVNYPAASIIILSLLRRRFTARCINSILRNTEKSFEVIIVDMGRSKGTVSWLRKLSAKYKNIKIIFNRNNVGTAKGRNQAIRRAEGRYVIFLDNDAQVSKNWLHPLIEAARRDSKVGASAPIIVNKKGRVSFCARYVKAYFKDKKLSRIGLDFKRIYDRNDPGLKRVKEVPWYPTTCLLVKREVLDKVGGFDENLFVAEEDKDLSLSIIKRGYRILCVPSSTVYHDNKNSPASYKKIRNNIPALMKDMDYFQKKWGCSVFTNYSRALLTEAGYTDRETDRLKYLDFLQAALIDK